MRLIVSYSIRQFGRKVNNNKQKQYANKFACLLTVQNWRVCGSKCKREGNIKSEANCSDVSLTHSAQLTRSLSLLLAQPASQLLGLLITVNRLPCPRRPLLAHSTLLLSACGSTRFQSTRFHFNFQFDFVAFFAFKQLFSVLLVLFCFECIATHRQHTQTHTQTCRHFRIFVSVSLYLYLRYSSCACVAEPSPKSICGMQPHGEISVWPDACCKCVLHAYSTCWPGKCCSCSCSLSCGTERRFV